MNRLIVAVLAAAALVPSILRAQEKLTLDGAVRIGLEESRSLKISAEKSAALSARDRELSASLLPSLKVDAGYRRLSDVDPFQIKVPFSAQPITVAPTVLDNYSLHAGIQQPLFTGFRLSSNVRAASELARAGRSDQKSDEDDLRVSVISAYWMCYQTIRTSEFMEQNVARMDAFLADTKRMMESGLATRNDVLRIEVQLTSAKLSRIDAVNDAQVAMMNLNNVIGRPVETEWAIASAPDTAGHSLQPFDVLRNSALSLRPEIEGMSARVEASKAALSAARGGYWPQIALSGNYYYQRPNTRWQPARDEFLGSWDVGVTLQMDIWNWGQTSAQSDQAHAQLRQTEVMLDQTKETVSLDVRRSYLAAQRADEKVQVSAVAIGQASENVRSIGEKYRNGLSTSTELLDANVALLQANLNYSGALAERENARARLSRAAGEWHR